MENICTRLVFSLTEWGRAWRRLCGPRGTGGFKSTSLPRVRFATPLTMMRSIIEFNNSENSGVLQLRLECETAFTFLRLPWCALRLRAGIFRASRFGTSARSGTRQRHQQHPPPPTASSHRASVPRENAQLSSYGPRPRITASGWTAPRPRQPSASACPTPIPAPSTPPAAP